MQSKQVWVIVVWIKFKDGIFYYNFGWRDMTATNFKYMFRILDVVDFSLKEGKKVSCSFSPESTNCSSEC